MRSIFEAADPDCAFVNAHAAAVHMALEAATGFRAARRYLTRARGRAKSATAREQAFVAAIYKWWRGDTRAALKDLRQLVTAYPADIVAAKWAQYLAFNIGDAGAMCAVAEAVMPAHRTTAEARGMLAFGFEQTDRFEEAEDAARHALSLKAAEPWAHHAIAHVMDTQGRIDEGIAFLTHHAPAWRDRGIFVREHNYWHLALMHLDRDEHAAALAIFDDRLWGEWPEFAQEQIGAISALWRLELRGESACAPLGAAPACRRQSRSTRRLRADMDRRGSARGAAFGGGRCRRHTRPRPSGRERDSTLAHPRPRGGMRWCP